MTSLKERMSTAFRRVDPDYSKQRLANAAQKRKEAKEQAAAAEEANKLHQRQEERKELKLDPAHLYPSAARLPAQYFAPHTNEPIPYFKHPRVHPDVRDSPLAPELLPYLTRERGIDFHVLDIKYVESDRYALSGSPQYYYRAQNPTEVRTMPTLRIMGQASVVGDMARERVVSAVVNVHGFLPYLRVHVPEAMLNAYNLTKEILKVECTDDASEYSCFYLQDPDCIEDTRYMRKSLSECISDTERTIFGEAERRKKLCEEAMVLFQSLIADRPAVKRVQGPHVARVRIQYGMKGKHYQYGKLRATFCIEVCVPAMVPPMRTAVRKGFNFRGQDVGVCEVFDATTLFPDRFAMDHDVGGCSTIALKKDTFHVRESKYKDTGYKLELDMYHVDFRGVMTARPDAYVADAVNDQKLNDFLDGKTAGKAREADAVRMAAKRDGGGEGKVEEKKSVSSASSASSAPGVSSVSSAASSASSVPSAPSASSTSSASSVPSISSAQSTSGMPDASGAPSMPSAHTASTAPSAPTLNYPTMQERTSAIGYISLSTGAIHADPVSELPVTVHTPVHTWTTLQSTWVDIRRETQVHAQFEALGNSQFKCKICLTDVSGTEAHLLEHTQGEKHKRIQGSTRLPHESADVHKRSAQRSPLTTRPQVPLRTVHGGVSPETMKSHVKRKRQDLTQLAPSAFKKHVILQGKADASVHMDLSADHPERISPAGLQAVDTAVVSAAAGKASAVLKPVVPRRTGFEALPLRAKERFAQPFRRQKSRERAAGSPAGPGVAAKAPVDTTAITGPVMDVAVDHTASDVCEVGDASSMGSIVDLPSAESITDKTSHATQVSHTSKPTAPVTREYTLTEPTEHMLHMATHETEGEYVTEFGATDMDWEPEDLSVSGPLPDKKSEPVPVPLPATSAAAAAVTTPAKTTATTASATTPTVPTTTTQPTAPPPPKPPPPLASLPDVSPPEKYISWLPRYKLASMDFEMASKSNHFPHADADDAVDFADSIEFSDRPGVFYKKLITMRKVLAIPNVDVEYCETQADFLNAVAQYRRATAVDVLTGWNINNFDIKYMYDRCHTLRKTNALTNDDALCWTLLPESMDVRQKLFQSKAFGAQYRIQVDLPGCNVFDMIRVIRADHKLSSYALNSVAEFFLEERKHDIDHFNITRFYERNETTRTKLGAYCVQDTILPLKINNKCKKLSQYVEMCRVTGVRLQMLLDRGQGAKTEMLILTKGKRRAFMKPYEPEEKRGEDKQYEGAWVEEGKGAGYYKDPITVLDHSSLYPSTMEMANVCFTTHVPKGEKDKFRPEDLICGKDALGKGNDVFFVRPHILPGLLPEILRGVLSARKRVQKLFEEAKKNNDEDLMAVYDGQQLAFKITANSIYGYCSGFSLRCVEAGACVTLFGRLVIALTAQLILEHFCKKNGYDFDTKLIYGDTDSVQLLTKPMDMKTAHALGDEMAAYVTALLPKPLNLAYEKTYHPYLLLSRKRYIGFYNDPKGKKDKVDSKGTAGVRRDNIPLLQKTIKDVNNLIFKEHNLDAAVKLVQSQYARLARREVSIAELIMSKTIAKKEHLETEEETEQRKRVEQTRRETRKRKRIEDGEWEMLPDVPKEDKKAKKSKKHDPTDKPLMHVMVARKMRARSDAGEKIGRIYRVGDRVPFVFVHRLASSTDEKVADCAEDPGYVMENDLPLAYDMYEERCFKKPLMQMFFHLLRDKFEPKFRAVRGGMGREEVKEFPQINFRELSEKQKQEVYKPVREFLFGPKVLRDPRIRAEAEKVTIPSYGAMGAKVNLIDRCAMCHCRLREREGVVCGGCRKDDPKVAVRLHKKYESACSEYREKVKADLKACIACQMVDPGATEVPCNTSDCPRLYKRNENGRRYAEASRKLGEVRRHLSVEIEPEECDVSGLSMKKIADMSGKVVDFLEVDAEGKKRRVLSGVRVGKLERARGDMGLVGNTYAVGLEGVGKTARLECRVNADRSVTYGLLGMGDDGVGSGNTLLVSNVF